MPSRSKKTIAAPFNAVDIDTIKKATPYIQRLIQDAQLRENVRTAFDSSRSAYARLSNGKAATKALIEDKKLQRDLHVAVEALRDATTALTEAPKKQARKSRGFGRKLFVLSLGFGLALAGQREAPHQGAGRGVRQGGGVPVHAAAEHGLDASELARRSCLKPDVSRDRLEDRRRHRRLRRVKGPERPQGLD